MRTLWAVCATRRVTVGRYGSPSSPGNSRHASMTPWSSSPSTLLMPPSETPSRYITSLAGLRSAGVAICLLPYLASSSFVVSALTLPRSRCSCSWRSSSTRRPAYSAASSSSEMTAPAIEHRPLGRLTSMPTTATCLPCSADVLTNGSVSTLRLTPISLPLTFMIMLPRVAGPSLGPVKVFARTLIDGMPNSMSHTHVASAPYPSPTCFSPGRTTSRAWGLQLPATFTALPTASRKVCAKNISGAGTGSPISPAYFARRLTPC
mmetsp:Transcript_21844/g.74238  ORF Transcript_21844/g.74238 Transcript_21844/m.74238 type:complete len:263 (+) Transcript_21844:633-1421(+)